MGQTEPTKEKPGTIKYSKLKIIKATFFIDKF